jgi:hypothetical protein
LPEIQVAILKEPLPLTNSVWDEKIQSLTDKTVENRRGSIPILFSGKRKVNQSESVATAIKNKQTFSKKWLIISGVILFLLISVIIGKSSADSDKLKLNNLAKDNSSFDDTIKNPVNKKEDNSKNQILTENNVNPIQENGEKVAKEIKDTDNDGIFDLDDECPRTYGIKENNGCPYVEIDNPQLNKKNRIVNIYNQYKTSPYGSTSIDKIEITDKYTILYFTHQLKLAKSTWVSIEPNAYIYDKGDYSYKELIYVSGIEISPSKTYAKKDNEIINFKLYFARVSENCKEIDFRESSSSSWQFTNIRF